MQNSSSEKSDPPDPTSAIELPLPVRGADLFKHTASPHVLNFLADNPEVNVSIRQLSNVTPVTERATREAVDALETNDLVETFHEGNARRVHVNRTRLHKPDDPIEATPQVQFRTPIRVAKRYLEDEFDDLLGIVLFGSAARGDADRQSDIDLWILVGGDLLEARHRANKLATELEELRIPPTVALEDASGAEFASNWPAIQERLESETAAHDRRGSRRSSDQRQTAPQRYSFEFVVETPQSILEQSTRVDPERLFGEGVTLHSTETLERVIEEVLDRE